MLVNRGYQAGDIVCFKISTGDEIVARIESETADSFVVDRPCTVVPSQRGIGLMQSLLCGEINNNIQLNKSHVIMHSAVIKDIENHYIQTTTGIQPVGNKGIIV
jgi:hypothetical protein